MPVNMSFFTSAPSTDSVLNCTTSVQHSHTESTFEKIFDCALVIEFLLLLCTFVPKVWRYSLQLTFCHGAPVLVECACMCVLTSMLLLMFYVLNKSLFSNKALDKMGCIMMGKIQPVRVNPVQKDAISGCCWNTVAFSQGSSGLDCLIIK